MTAGSDAEHFNASVMTVARTDVATLPSDFTIQRALDSIRRQGVGEKVVYFYVVDPEKRLAGVLPTRRLLTAGAEERLSDVMISRVVAIPSSEIGRAHV